MTYASVPGQVGGQDIFGPYDVVKGWPKDISTVPGNEKWTYGAGQAIFAESPNRIYALFRGELPNIKRPETKTLTDMGPSIKFPVGRLPWRDATVSSPPGAGGTGQDPKDGMKAWAAAGTSSASMRSGKTASSCSTATATSSSVGRSGTSILKRPHFVAVNPYDPEKHVWIVDDHSHAIYKITHDGKQHRADHRHARRRGRRRHAFQPPDLSRLAAGQHDVRRRRLQRHARRQVRQGRQVPDGLGREGHAAERQASRLHFNNVHGIAVDPQTRQVFVNDRGNHRVQVFDENGKYLREWSFGDDPSDIHLI